MTIPADNLAKAVGREAAAELDGGLRKIEHCLRQLTEPQLSWRPAESMNSIGILTIHLCGNVRQWIVSGVGGSEDTRNRPQEFADPGLISKDEIAGRLDAVVTDAKDVLSRVTADDLMQSCRIQGFDVTKLQAVIESVAHFRGHSQEIVHLTRYQLGDSYQFAFVPGTPEQGASVD